MCAGLRARMAASIASAAAAAAAAELSGAGTAKAEDLRQLQTQVEQLKERLDFISPMLPLVNFIQDYFQKVECEATLQLLRFKNAQLLRKNGETNAEDEVSNAQLELVKWLHFATDAITSLHGTTSATSSLSVQHEAASPTNPGKPTMSKLHDGMPPTRNIAMSLHEPRFPAGLREFSGQCGSSPKESASPVGAASSAGQKPINSRKGSFVCDQAAPFTPSSPQGRLSASAASSTISAITEEKCDFLLGAADQANWTKTASHHTREIPRMPLSMGSTISPVSLEGCEPPLVEPGTGGTVAEACMLDGLVLGRGSWAAAYRQSQGPRREALRLLCRSSIVTARELSDDLTVISQEHIDECVMIASEMLQTWPLEMWARQPDEAKKFFEARLTIVYQKRFGERKG